MTEENDPAPAMELDFGIGRIYVKGDEDTSFEEVVDEFNRQKDDMTETIQELKEFDYELREEYDTETPSGPSFS
ncbi:hypothetical protein M199_gp096 [Halogranum tailed virus 1]|uniref:Uncharacterized protein n=1 Tax=Halogranum tailed virus 1 TaxID=1273749 RepID=R4T9G6_9CAUD|nr:hypothetical protein M199_gp096 [Halogranum tailed virus 1]AGM11570.1 hypothetical protein HGTV1_273 [Halogranum tailed virus 1]